MQIHDCSRRHGMACVCDGAFSLMVSGRVSRARVNSKLSNAKQGRKVRVSGGALCASVHMPCMRFVVDFVVVFLLPLSLLLAACLSLVSTHLCIVWICDWNSYSNACVLLTAVALTDVCGRHRRRRLYCWCCCFCSLFFCHYIAFLHYFCCFFSALLLIRSYWNWSGLLFCFCRFYPAGAAADTAIVCVYVCIYCGLVCTHNLMTNIIMNRMSIFFLLRRYTCNTQMENWWWWWWWWCSAIAAMKYLSGIWFIWYWSTKPAYASGICAWKENNFLCTSVALHVCANSYAIFLGALMRIPYVHYYILLLMRYICDKFLFLLFNLYAPHALHYCLARLVCLLAGWLVGWLMCARLWKNRERVKFVDWH